MIMIDGFELLMQTERIRLLFCPACVPKEGRKVSKFIARRTILNPNNFAIRSITNKSGLPPPNVEVKLNLNFCNLTHWSFVRGFKMGLLSGKGASDAHPGKSTQHPARFSQVGWYIKKSEKASPAAGAITFHRHWLLEHLKGFPTGTSSAGSVR